MNAREISVKSTRIHQLNGKKQEQGPVIYWMSRDQRVSDNWSLLYALELSAEINSFVIVAFALTNSFPGANMRHYGFMIRGLMEVEKKLASENIQFCLLTGNPPETIAELTKSVRASAIVTDFDPLHIKKEWKNNLLKLIDIPLYDVDAHNIVPCRIASDKLEFAAYTIRPKIKKLLNDYMEKYPDVWSKSSSQSGKSPASRKMNYETSANHGTMLHDGNPFCKETVNWEKILRYISSEADNGVKEVTWLVSGEDAAFKVLDNFLDKKLAGYDNNRNDANADASSGLSPYLHFGQISAQRIAQEVIRASGGDSNTEAFLEELIIRRELSDNYCHFNPQYDTFEGFHEWAKTTLNNHRKDEREYLYGREEFEMAQTHDPLWNAAQIEMVNRGKMHGYMRMYWAKKMLEWTPSPEKALETAIYLNDKYELDGRDPNGYTGCAWSIGGVHDRAWGERPVYGKIRYMNASGCKRKFNTDLYIKTNPASKNP